MNAEPTWLDSRAIAESGSAEPATCREPAAVCCATAATSRIALTTWSVALFCCWVAAEISLAADGGLLDHLEDLVERVAGDVREIDARLHLLELLLGGDDEVVRRALDLGHDRADLAGGVDDRLGELADLDGHDREALAGLAGARGLDGGVEREDLGLVGDVVDDREHLADLLAALAEREDLVRRWTACGS